MKQRGRLHKALIPEVPPKLQNRMKAREPYMRRGKHAELGRKGGVRIDHESQGKREWKKI